MVNIMMPRQLDLFKEFALQWQESFGGHLYLVSSQGEVLANSAPQVSLHNFDDIVAQISKDTPAIVPNTPHPVLTAPLRDKDEILGYLMAVDADEKNLSVLSWGASHISQSLRQEQALQDMTDELIGAWDQLGLIYRLTQNLTFSTDLMAAMHTILTEISKVVGTSDGFVLLHRAQTLTSMTATGDTSSYYHSQDLLDLVVTSDRVITCPDAMTCRQLWADMPTFVNNMMAVRVPVDDGVDAALGLVNKYDPHFTAADTKLLMALAQQVGTTVKNFLIHQNLIIKERLSRELEIAAEIQESLLPANLPQLGGLSMSVALQPASEVGGDFYDFITVDDHNLTLVIGDVSGKGVPAAMLTSMTRTILRVEAMHGHSPEHILAEANNILHEDLSRSDSFVTVFVATIDTHAGTLRYANAGHVPPIVWRAVTRTTEQLKATSLPIGIYGYQSCEGQEITLNAGDTIVCYTDGITEAQAPNGELFGQQRLIYAIDARGSDSPENLQQFIRAETSSFRRGLSGRDDATLLITKILPQINAPHAKNISTVLKTVHFSYPADTQYLVDISKEIIDVCRQIPLKPGPQTDDFVYLIELAISEICTNIIKHAYASSSGNITGYVTLLSNGIQLDFYDQGISFDPSAVPQPKTDPQQLREGGYGLHIVRQIMDVVKYEHQPEMGNHWHLIKFYPTP